MTNLRPMPPFHPKPVRLALATLFTALTFSLGFAPESARAGLDDYDAAVVMDDAIGLPSLSKLTTPVVLNGSNRSNFDFGNTSGDVTMEFILEGDPVGGGLDGYLAVGANATSNLRYEQWSNTGQLGFTQLGVEDYLFFPAVPSPTMPVHIAYAWNNTSKMMTLYLNGSIAGSRSSVNAGFAMPNGAGYLGANPSNAENMLGTIYRVTVYNSLIPEDAIQRHADAFNDVVRLPIIVSFAATPTAIFTPDSSTLTWEVVDADAVSINGTDVTSLSELTVTPTTTTTYTLTATNLGGSVTAQATVQVNPAPVIQQFTASKTYLGAGETIHLSWTALFGLDFTLQPAPGEVTEWTTNGIGGLDVQPTVSTTYELTVMNTFGSATAELAVHIVQPAGHLVISEFMADDETTLADEDGQHSGWIEIHNPTASPISLAGHYLTDDADDPTRWAFPEVELAPAGYLVVFASGKNRTDPGSPLHTNFELKNDGEYLALVGPGPSLLHGFSPAFPPQRADVAFGILGGDPSLERYLGLPTPGAENDETPAPPGRIRFSHPSGTFTEAFDVTLTADTPGAEIRYTTDGSAPGLNHGTLYSTPIPINATTRLRAVAVAPTEGLVSRFSSVSYIKLAPELATYTSSLPILVIENFGAGIIPQKGWSGTGAGIRQLPRQEAVWATFESADQNHRLAAEPQMISDIGIRGRGAYSTTWRQKPYSVEAVNAQGEETDVSPLGMPAHSDWTLYFPDPDDNKDPTLLFNTFAYELSANSGRYSVRFRWVEVFVNENGGDLSLTDRRGVYAVMEKVSRGKNRLDFEKLSDDGTTGSWLLNINRMDAEPEDGWPASNGATQPQFFHTAGPNRIQETPPNTPSVGDDIPRQSNGFLNFDNPGGYTINPAQRAAIEDWFRQFEDVLYNNAVWRDPINGYRQYLDDLDFIDYFILNVLTRNGDGLLISMFPWKGDDGKLRMGPAWDYNWSAYYISGGNPTGALYHRSDRLWYPRLFNDPDFTQRYIDRWWELRLSSMSNEAMDAIVDGQAATISPEKALLNGMPSTTEWANRLATMKSWLKTRANWIDGNYLRPPVFNQNGGPVPEGFQLVILGTNGTLYVTTDGNDPRAPGGDVAASAQVYAGPVAILGPTRVQARIRNGNNWSGLTTAFFYPPQNLTPLALTEIMYNPPAYDVWTGDDLEFLELKNTGSIVLNLGGLNFTAGIQFTFAPGTQLDPGQFLVLGRNSAALQARYPGLTVDGVYSGRLDNGGETIRLSTPGGTTVVSVTYNDRAPWPIAADGYGFSAVPRSPGSPANSDQGRHWRASSGTGGSPGMDDPASTIPQIVINEVLTHTDLPQIDTIELFNPEESDAAIGGWWLSDDGSVPAKFRIPEGTIVPAHGYALFDEDDFNPTPGTLFNFSLDSAGDSVYLTSADAAGNLTGYSHGIGFGAAANGVTFGRYVNSIGEEQFPAQIAPTPLAENAGPRIGPVVIQEIHYHPEPGQDEFIELRNLTGNDVPLFDLAYSSNTWRVNGLGFDLPENTVLPPNGLLLIVPTEPAVFRARYDVPAGTLVVGPYDGNLQDSGENLALQYPDTPDTNGVAYITVDEVRYNDKNPWPPGADGSGPSLQRLTLSAYGNDPIHWTAALPTPGRVFAGGQAPVITLQPQSQTIVAYQDALFLVTATGTGPLFYQWLFNGAPISGATNDTLLVTKVQPSQAGRYQAVAYNATGTATSADALLTTLLPAVILQQPQDVTLVAGQTATFSVSAFGTGALQYQWNFEGEPIANATSATLSVTSAQAINDGLYTVVITDDIGPIESEPARLTVLLPPVFIQGPQNQSVPLGGTAVFSVTTTGTLPISYRWRRGSFTVTNVTLNSHISFLTLTNVQSIDVGGYTVVATNVAFVSPGVLSSRGNLTLAVDTDGDGIPDDWETAAGLNPNDPADAALDKDGDTMSNGDEYIAGTDPGDPLSYLKVDDITPGSAVTIEFIAVAGKTYTVEYTEALGRDMWHRLADVPAPLETRTELVQDPNPAPGRYYRLVTPRQP